MQGCGVEANPRPRENEGSSDGEERNQILPFEGLGGHRWRSWPCELIPYTNVEDFRADAMVKEIGFLRIDCSNNQLTGLPQSLGKCLYLSELKASNNCIASLPKELENCMKLIKVDFEGNRIIELLENIVSSWTMLIEFNASKNLLNCIPENIRRLSRLIRLDLHQNRISSIPSSLNGCSSLAEFYLGNNMLLSLPAELGELHKLGTLDLHSNQGVKDRNPPILEKSYAASVAAATSNVAAFCSFYCCAIV